MISRRSSLSRVTDVLPHSTRAAGQHAAAQGKSLRSVQPFAGRLALLLAALACLFAFSIVLGRYPSVGLIAPSRVLEDELAQRLIFNLRLPRLIAALLLGMALSASGVVFQLLFNNPLVEPGFLGVSQGAAFGSALVIVFFGSTALAVQLGAAGFALIGLGLSYLLARRILFGGWVLRLVLAGIAISALFSAGLGLLKYLADPLTQLPAITFWLLGGLSSITWSKLVTVLPATVIGLAVLFLYRWRLNVLALDDRTAFSLGVSTQRERFLILLAAVLPVAALTSVAGIVGWVGLIIPHLARRLFSADARGSLPAAMLLGALFTIVCDNLARTLLAGEIPLGILTSFSGALAFLSLMSTRRLQSA